MKKLIVLLLLLCPYLAHAGDYALQIEQKVPGTNPYYNALYIEEIGQSAFMFYNYTTHLPRYYRLGAGLSCNDTTETCSATGMAPTSFPFSGLTGLPTTCAGYGITDCVTPSSLASSLTSYVTTSGLTSALAPYALTSALSSYATTTALATKFTTPTGTTSQYVRGDGTLATLPVLQTAITGTTSKFASYRLYQSYTITTAGTAVFQLTADGTSTGTALFTNEVFTDSVQPIVNDATASYQLGWAFSNSNKTLTVTVNKLSTANILTGVLGQAVAPVGTVVKLAVEGR